VIFCTDNLTHEVLVFKFSYIKNYRLFHFDETDIQATVYDDRLTAFDPGQPG